MPPANNTFGGGVTETVLGTGVLVLMLIAIFLALLLPRKWVLAPLMFGIFLFPAQTLVIGGFHVFVSRILIFVGLVRSGASRSSDRPFFGGGFNAIDGLFIMYVVFHASAFVLLYQAMGAVVNQFGFIWDALGGYLLVRFLIHDDDDVRRVIKIFSAIAVVLAGTMLYEKFLHVNLYGFIGGHPIISEIRKGSLRAQGPFHHAILAGTFGATLLPLFFWLWKSGKSRFLGLFGMFASVAITISSASSTPVLAFLVGTLAICFWPIRDRMQIVRWGIVIAILALNFVMNAPVWWAIEHIDFAGGSAGQHRAELVDNFIRHFPDWWLIGTKDNANWGFEMWDQSNQYVADGEGGGLAPLVCLIGIIYLGFKWIGISRRSVKGHRELEWYYWLLGSALFSHCVAFMGISYFDQTRVTWFALLAMISAATAPLIKAGALPPQGKPGEVAEVPVNWRLAYTRLQPTARSTNDGLDSRGKHFKPGSVQVERK
jgi:hypothetical protein